MSIQSQIIIIIIIVNLKINSKIIIIISKLINIIFLIRRNEILDCFKLINKQISKCTLYI